MKICTKCQLPKELNQFNKGKGRDGLHCWCKSCFSTYKAAYRQKNKAEIAANQAVYRQVNKAEIATQKAAYRQDNKTEIAARQVAYQREHRGAIAARMKDYHQKISAKRAAGQRAHKLADPTFKLILNLRGRLGKAVKGLYKSGSAVSDLGCTIPELRTHLESQFYPNPITGEVMTWENWSRTGWHIDHERPLSLLQKDPTNRALFLELNHFTNLQPLWAIDNYAKGARSDWQREAA